MKGLIRKCYICSSDVVCVPVVAQLGADHLKCPVQLLVQPLGELV